MQRGGEVAPGRRSGRRSEEDAERTQRAIVDAALKLFAGRGFKAVSLRDIAEGAGVAHNIIRYHFRSKEGVWRAVVDRAAADYVSSLQPVLDEVPLHEDPEIELAKITRGIVHTSALHPELVRLLLAEGVCGGERLAYLLGRVEPLRQTAAPLFARLQGRGPLGLLDPDDLFLLVLAVGAAPFALAALTKSILGEEVLKDAYADRHADGLLRVLFGEASGP